MNAKIVAAVNRTRGFHGDHLSVLVALAALADDQGHSPWLPLPLLEDQSGVDERNASRIVHELHVRGVLILDGTGAFTIRLSRPA